jgi:hypothetical protein
MPIYRIDDLGNGLLRVFDYGTKWGTYFHRDGTYAHGELRVATMAELLKRLDNDERIRQREAPTRSAAASSGAAPGASARGIAAAARTLSAAPPTLPVVAPGAPADRPTRPPSRAHLSPAASSVPSASSALPPRHHSETPMMNR